MARPLPAPADLVEAAVATLPGGEEAAAPQAKIIPLRPAPATGRPAPVFETFQLLAAASDAGDPAIVCQSQSGVWTLEVFVGQSDEDRTKARGYLLLTVHPDHASTYEGRPARVFVDFGNEERVLAEETVRNGEIYAPISLIGLDLRTRDAVSAVFGPVLDEP